MAKKVARIEKLTTKEEMTTLFERLYTAFILGDMEDEQIVEQLEDVEYLKFTEYTTWIPQRGLIMLKCHLSDGDSELQRECRKRVEAVTNSGSDEQIEAFNMMLEGELTGVDLLAVAKESEESEWEHSLYLMIIAQLVTIVEMGGSRKYGYPLAMKSLESYLREARKRW
ncbi:MAG: hypothetical protein SNG35_01355 [Rikenellaceae bacterium]